MNLQAVRSSCIATAIAAGALAGACLWDRDTLAEEARGSMDLVSTIVGRFERNPPLYYEMRLTRVAMELEANPRRLELYDDAAVAADRLGKPDEALAWIWKKRALLEPLGLRSRPALREAWYRTLANEGTFYAHRWIKRGAPAGSLADLKRAKATLERALRVNPGAHFGREKVQLSIIDWLIENRKRKPEPLSTYLVESGNIDDRRAEETAKGLAGLVRLGNAWHSVDVFLALQTALSRRRSAAVGRLAYLRAQEVSKAGVSSLEPGFKGVEASPSSEYEQEEAMLKHIERQYVRLRVDADAWHAEREAYMLGRLKSGEHPDTHPTFWSGYRERPQVAIERPPFLKSAQRRALETYLLTFTILAIVITPLVASIIALLRLGARRARLRAAVRRDAEPPTRP